MSSIGSKSSLKWTSVFKKYLSFGIGCSHVHTYVLVFVLESWLLLNFWTSLLWWCHPFHNIWHLQEQFESPPSPLNPPQASHMSPYPACACCDTLNYNTLVSVKCLLDLQENQPKYNLPFHPCIVPCFRDRDVFRAGASHLRGES